MDSNMENQGPAVVKLNWILAALSSIVIALRLYVRLFITRRPGWDDLMMGLSYGLAVVTSAFIQVSVNHGLGRHVQTLSSHDKLIATKFDYMAQPPAIMSPAFGRIAFALMLLDIIPIQQKKRRAFLWVISASQLAINISCFILILVQCSPIEALWDKSIKDAKCWSLIVQANYGFFQGSCNVIADFILAVFPASIIWNLQLALTVKISLIGLMSLGIFAMVASAVKVALLDRVGSSEDYTWNTALLVIWWTLEMYLVIIAASIPTIKPLFSKQKARGSSAESYGLRSRSLKERISARRGELQTLDDDNSVFRGLNGQQSPDNQGIQKTTSVAIRYGAHDDGSVEGSDHDNWRSPLHAN